MEKVHIKENNCQKAIINVNTPRARNIFFLALMNNIPEIVSKVMHTSVLKTGLRKYSCKKDGSLLR